MRNSIEIDQLKHTPFLIMSRDRKTFVVGRSDTNEVLCIGSFNKSLAALFNENDFVFLQIKTDDTAEEVIPAKPIEDPFALISINNDIAIVGVKVGSYWITPPGFDDWAKKIFPGI